MTAALVRRVVRRAAAAALAVTIGASTMMLGAGTASAAPREVACTIDLRTPTQPVQLREGEQVQLVLKNVPVLGDVKLGPAQTALPGTEQLSAQLTPVVAQLLGVLGDTVCRTAVQVQTAVSSAVPLPPVTLPSLPQVLPSQSVQVPVPGLDVAVQPGGSDGAPGTGTPPAGQPDPPQSGPSSPPPLTSVGSTNTSIPGYRFDQGRIPLYDFTSVPYGVSTRFGAAAAPAFRFGQRVPGYAPQFGILGAEDAKDDVAGKVQALPLRGPTAVGLPVLLAVLMLSTVSGALVRTWTLRRAV